MPDSSTILLVDDEDAVQKLLAYPLEKDGFRVVQARDGQEALEQFGREQVDLVVLDVMLPKVDGLEVCKRLRAESTVPIIMLTARDDELDKVLGLELGADDYITKPFSIREFRSRVRALLRRAATTPAPGHPDELIESDGLRIDLGTREVEAHGRPVQLTYVEFELLRTLASHAGRVYTREQLLQALWGGSDYREPRTIDVHVRHLREKLELDPREPEFILTVRGVGYRFPQLVNRFFRSVGTRLSLALLLVVAIALGIVYLAVVPSLENRLVNARVSQLQGDAERLAPQAASAVLLQDFVTTAAADTGVRVMVFAVTPAPDGKAVGSPIAESNLGQSSLDVNEDPIATRSAVTLRPHSGALSRGDNRWAEAAAPFTSDGANYVLLLRDSLASQHGSVHLVQRRVLLSAGVALLIALALGYGGAWAFARRIRRLERAADRIAGGRFDKPVRDPAGDELGDLAAAFERMRSRLAQLDNARREFVANASHELRTPLFSLAGFLELMDDEDLDEATKQEFLDQMREQVARLTKLASDLLDLSRLDAGRMSVEREPVDLASLGEELVDEFGPAARAGGHELEVEEHRGAVATADELRVFQIGRILVENALLHTLPGTAVRVRALQRDGSAVLEVEDEGDGIPPGQREQLFERFYRLDGTRASGSGLGLAIAKELAELMDGRITADSQPGRTVFALVLPLAHQAEPISREITPALS